MAHPIYILSIETSSEACSVALHQTGKLVGQLAYHVTQAHSRVLPTMVDKILQLHKVEATALAAIAVSEGPGSYTGLRVGMAFAKGFAFALSLPLIKVNTVDTLLASLPAIPASAGVWVALLASRNERAIGVVANLKDKKLQSKPQTYILKNETFVTIWKPLNPCYFVGKGAEEHVALISSWPNCWVVPHVYTLAAAMGELAYQQFQAKTFVDLANCSPIYFPLPADA